MTWDRDGCQGLVLRGAVWDSWELGADTEEHGMRGDILPAKRW